MELSIEQIKLLRTFIRKKGVKYFDLQDELIDHMSSGIEDQLEENPNIKFEDALLIEYKKFGIFGFDEVLSARKKVLIRDGFKVYLLELLGLFNKGGWLFFTVLFYIIYLLHAYINFSGDIVEILLTALFVLPAVFILMKNYGVLNEAREYVIIQKFIWPFVAVPWGYDMIICNLFLPLNGDLPLRSSLISSLLLWFAIILVIMDFKIIKLIKDELNNIKYKSI